MSFVGGKLKLKGGETLKSSGGVKKKKKESGGASLVPATGTELDAKEEDAEQKTLKAIRGYALEQDAAADRRTEAERKFEERFKKVEEGKLKKLAHKTHRDRVKDFNEHLASLSEHHDIPKVGPG